MDERPSDEALSPEQRIGRLEMRVSEIERAIGEASDPIEKTPATGLVGAVVGLQTALTTLTDELRAEKKSRDDRRAFWSKVGWALSIPAAVSALLGLGALAWRWISTLHH